MPNIHRMMFQKVLRNRSLKERWAVDSIIPPANPSVRVPEINPGVIMIIVMIGGYSSMRVQDLCFYPDRGRRAVDGFIIARAAERTTGHDSILREEWNP